MIRPSREQYDQIFQQIDALSIWRPAVGPKAKFPAFDPTHRYHNDLGLDIEYNHDIPMRDGIKLRGNIFRPAGSQDSKLPVLLSITPYGKDNPFDIGHFKQSKDFDAGIDGVYRSKYYVFEASDPVFWCRHGFAVVHADPRGSYASEGDRLSFLTKADGLDGHDAIEYFGNQPWTNSRVAMYGASALSVVQWHVAAWNPPHLSAILVQGGWTDMYRHVAHKGGIRDQQFRKLLCEWKLMQGNSVGSRVQDIFEVDQNHEFDDEYWELLRPKLEDVTCPTFVQCTWTDAGLHLPGSICGWRTIRSEVKYLEISGNRKWEYHLTDESLEKQLAFLTRFLFSEPNDVSKQCWSWPPVRLQIRDKHLAGYWRSESEFPIHRTIYSKFGLSSEGELVVGSSDYPLDGTISYDAKTETASWIFRFDEPTEITGYARLHLRIATTEGNDIDLLATFDKLDRHSKLVDFPHHTVINDEAAAFGWLRASRRKEAVHDGIDIKHTHVREDEQLLAPNTPVELNLAIQPTSILFRKGESLKLTVQGHDSQGHAPGRYSDSCLLGRFGTGRNQGQHVVFLKESYLILPTVPAKHAV